MTGVALRPDDDTDVSRGVPWPRLDPYAVIEGKIHGDQLGLATVHDRQQAIFVVRVGRVFGSQFSYPPGLPLLTGKEVAGIRKGRHPSATKEARVRSFRANDALSRRVARNHRAAPLWS